MQNASLPEAKLADFLNTTFYDSMCLKGSHGSRLYFWNGEISS